MTTSFSAQHATTRIVFAAGSWSRLPAELAALGVERALLVATPRGEAEARQLAAALGPRAQGVLAIAAQHVPAELADRARRAAAEARADAVIAVGGGSAIGLGKAVALDGVARLVALPTTCSGSEMTSIYGITGGKEKRTGRDDRVRAALVLYDPAATLAVPAAVSVASMWNAMAHAVQALWSADELDPAAALAAERGLALLAGSLLRVAGAPGDLSARSDALEGACLAGRALDAAGTGLHHRLCHVLGGMFGMVHASAHAALLPHTVRMNGATAAMARALGAVDPVAALAGLAQASGVQPLALAPADIEQAVETALAAPAANPRPVDAAALARVLRAASQPRPQAAPAARAPAELAHLSGFGATLSSEAIPGALPPRQNAPRNCPLGLHPELLSGTPFTMRRAENTRAWMYRIQPSSTHGPLAPLPEGLFGNRFEAPLAERTRWQPLPLPARPVDFVDGLVTLGGHGAPGGAGYAVHLYASSASMANRSLMNADGDLLLVPEHGALDVQTELGWLRAAPGTVVVVPRGLAFAVHLAGPAARGYLLEVWGSRIRLPERGPIGSNGLAETRHFLAPTAAFEDVPRPGYQRVIKHDGRLFAAASDASPFDVVAWYGEHVPFSYDLMLFCPMGTVAFDHPDPSIHTVLTAPLDDHGRAIADFVAFRGRWEVSEGSLRPPFHHRNAASEVNGIIKVASADSGYVPGCTFVTPLLAPHGITSSVYDRVLDLPDDVADRASRISDDSLWIMFESALPFRATSWALTSPTLDPSFRQLFGPVRRRFQPPR
ncbi:MAG TPA: iron-containing alcohol dehydrogenase [Kofleriaceae bacterium]